MFIIPVCGFDFVIDENEDNILTKKNRTVISIYLVVAIAFKLYYLFICFDY